VGLAIISHWKLDFLDCASKLAQQFCGSKLPHSKVHFLNQASLSQ
jgi:hypothetical protein